MAFKIVQQVQDAKELELYWNFFTTIGLEISKEDTSGENFVEGDLTDRMIYFTLSKLIIILKYFTALERQFDYESVKKLMIIARNRKNDSTKEFPPYLQVIF